MKVWAVVFGDVAEPVEFVAVYSTEAKAVEAGATLGSGFIFEAEVDGDVPDWLKRDAAFIEQYRREHA